MLDMLRKAGFSQGEKYLCWISTYSQSHFLPPEFPTSFPMLCFAPLPPPCFPAWAALLHIRHATSWTPMLCRNSPMPIRARSSSAALSDRTYIYKPGQGLHALPLPGILRLVDQSLCGISSQLPWTPYKPAPGPPQLPWAQGNAAVSCECWLCLSFTQIPVRKMLTLTLGCVCNRFGSCLFCSWRTGIPGHWFKPGDW